ncbi:hypothetical protein A0J61_00705 [Choanephora cucurbitarum]|uniref:F-box domain-containing protein n=1 Tax=Choanephora cucurbitarum TaxID=101091 RepID=A0A1C7NQ40_9FUNG|nr:hypothetical protein A0J61_00705 [Choanephora cucurbitarum]
MLANLPIEIHNEILSYLPRLTLLQYQLVCRQWSEPARRAFYRNIYLSSTKRFSRLFDLIRTRPSIGLMAKQLETHFPGWDRESKVAGFSKSYLELAKLTPNMERIIRLSATVILDIVKEGYWTQLHQLDLLCEQTKTDEYYELVLLLCKQLSSVSLNASHLSNSVKQGSDLTYLSWMTQSARFDKATELICSDLTGQSIQVLDAIVNLFPSVKEVTLESASFEENASQLSPFEPSQYVKKLTLYFDRLTRNHIEYIFDKFPKADQVFLVWRQMHNPFIFDYLISRLQGMGCIGLSIWNDNFILKSICAFIEMPFKNRKNFSYATKLGIRCIRRASGSVFTSLNIGPPSNEDIDFTSEEGKTLLKEVNELVLFDWVLRDFDLLNCCSQLTRLKIEKGEVENDIGELGDSFYCASITDLELRDGICSTESLHTIAQGLPNLKNIVIYNEVLYPQQGDADANKLVIDLSSTSIASLKISHRYSFSQKNTYIKLTTEDRTACYRVHDYLFYKIALEEYMQVGQNRVRIDLTCRSIKTLSLDFHPKFAHYTFE